MREASWSVAIVLGFATAAVAPFGEAHGKQDGGKLQWMGKSGDPKTAMLDARDQNRPIMLFFSSEG